MRRDGASPGGTERVSVGPGGLQADGTGSYTPAISADGRFVAFQSYATNLLGPGADTNGRDDVFTASSSDTGPHVVVFDPVTQATLESFFAFQSLNSGSSC